jgi:Flp pilus assembly protein TadG
MAKSRWTNWARVARDTNGAELAESAAILPLLFMVLMAIFWFGQAYRIYGTLTHATRAGARAAVAPVCTTCSAGVGAAKNAQAALENALQAASLDKNQLLTTSSWTAPTLCLCGNASANSSCTAQATCDGSVTEACVQLNVQLSFPSQGGMGTCGTSVSARYKYPYHFHIPLTTLDLGNISLPGQAEMRAETQ